MFFKSEDIKIDLFLISILTIYLLIALFIGYNFFKIQYFALLLVSLFLFFFTKKFIYFIIPITLFLINFDNTNFWFSFDIFGISIYRIRLWYFNLFLINILILLNFRYYVVDYFKNLNLINIFLLYLFAVFPIYLIFFSEGILFQLKFYLIQINFILSFYLIFNKLEKSEKYKALVVINYCLYFFVFWGIIQYFFSQIYSISDLTAKINHDYPVVSPPSFLTERTWYGQLCSYTLILTFFSNLHLKKKLFYSIFCLLGSVLSSSLSALIPLFILMIYSIFKINFLSVMKTIISRNVLIVILIIILFFLYLISNHLVTIFYKLLFNPLRYRDLFFSEFFIDFFNNPKNYFLGNGFFWNNYVTEIGTGLGANSANLFLRIFYIFGLFGLSFFLLFCYGLSKNFLINYSNSKNNFLICSLLIFSSYLMLGMFVPVGQYMPSFVFLFLSFALFDYGKSIK